MHGEGLKNACDGCWPCTHAAFKEAAKSKAKQKKAPDEQIFLPYFARDCAPLSAQSLIPTPDTRALS